MKRAAASMGNVGLLVLSLVGVSLAKQEAPGAKSQMPHPAMASKATVWAASDLKWEPMPGVQGVRVAKLWGDMDKGAYAALVKLPANSKHPLHTHTNAIKAVVIFGEFVYRPEDGPETVLGPGSYLMIPGGLRHTSGTRSAGCEIFQEQAGKWDLVPVPASTAAANHKAGAATKKTAAATHKTASHKAVPANQKTVAANHK